MERQVTKKLSWWQVETNHGIEYIEADLVTPLGLPEAFNNYVEGTCIFSHELIQGYGARLSAPGYMDCTEWAVFDTVKEAITYLDERYPEDESCPECGQFDGHTPTCRHNGESRGTHCTCPLCWG